LGKSTNFTGQPILNQLLFYIQGKISTLVIFALKEIGKDKATDRELKLIKEALALEKEENIIHDLMLAPEWISKIIKKLTDNE
jgi:predicted metal-dependent TIM-barrel fold hydrolase